MKWRELKCMNEEQAKDFMKWLAENNIQYQKEILIIDRTHIVFYRPIGREQIRYCETEVERRINSWM